MDDMDKAMKYSRLEVSIHGVESHHLVGGASCIKGRALVKPFGGVSYLMSRASYFMGGV